MSSLDSTLLDYFNKIRNGDLSCFDAFYEKTKKQVYFYIAKIVDDLTISEDIMQDVYVYLLENAKKIKHSSSPLGYLLLCAKHMSLDYLKKNKKLIDIEPIAHLFYVEDETYSDLFLKVSTILNKEEIEILFLHLIYDFSHREIAKLLNKPLGTILWKYNLIVKKLRKELIDYVK